MTPLFDHRNRILLAFLILIPSGKKITLFFSGRIQHNVRTLHRIKLRISRNVRPAVCFIGDPILDQLIFGPDHGIRLNVFIITFPSGEFVSVRQCKLGCLRILTVIIGRRGVLPLLNRFCLDHLVTVSCESNLIDRHIHCHRTCGRNGFPLMVLRFSRDNSLTLIHACQHTVFVNCRNGRILRTPSDIRFRLRRGKFFNLYRLFVAFHNSQRLLA